MARNVYGKASKVYQNFHDLKMLIQKSGNVEDLIDILQDFKVHKSLPETVTNLLEKVEMRLNNENRILTNQIVEKRAIDIVNEEKRQRKIKRRRKAD